MAEDSGLVPTSLADFRSAEFWNGFFRARNEQAFEWYGAWRDLQALLLPFLKESTSKAVLVPGCGNSDLSAGL